MATVMPGIPYKGRGGYGGLNPRAVICHRTYGVWAGDYSVGMGSRGSIGFHFLVGKEEGQWVQFTPIDRLCYHAKGANNYSIGIEVTGVNGDPFTDWQVRAVAAIVGWIHAQRPNIALDYDDGGRGRHGSNGAFMAHNAVSGSDHGDLWTRHDWNRVMATVGHDVPVPVVVAEAPPYPGGLYQKGSRGDVVRRIQQRLTDRGWNLGAVDGIYGPKTAGVVRKFQAEKTQAGWDTGGVDAVVGPKTWSVLWESAVS